MAPVEMVFTIQENDVVKLGEVEVVVFDASDSQKEKLIEETKLSVGQEMTVPAGSSALVYGDGIPEMDLIDSFDGKVAGLINYVELRVGETVEGIVPGMTYIGR